MRGVFLAVAVLALAPGGADAQQARPADQAAATPADGVAPLVDASGLLYNAVPPAQPSPRARRDMARGAPWVVARDGGAVTVSTSVGDRIDVARHSRVGGANVTTTTIDAIQPEPRRERSTARGRRPRR